MSRIQLALNVSDLDAATKFYSTLFATEPHKRKPGYVNFAIEEPPLKLILVAGEGPGGTVNHLGVEVDSSRDVITATDRLAEAGLDTDVRSNELCCHATQDKVWVTGADSERWEIYTILDDSPEASGELTGTPLPMACC